jgi:hypothetical protein
MGANQLHYRTSAEHATKMLKPTKFELARAEPIGLQNQLLNHSDTVSVRLYKNKKWNDLRGNRTPNLRAWNPTRCHCAMKSFTTATAATRNQKHPRNRSRTSDLEISVVTIYSLPLCQLSYTRTRRQTWNQILETFLFCPQGIGAGLAR